MRRSTASRSFARPSASALRRVPSQALQCHHCPPSVCVCGHRAARSPVVLGRSSRGSDGRSQASEVIRSPPRDSPAQSQWFASPAARSAAGAVAVRTSHPLFARPPLFLLLCNPSPRCCCFVYPVAPGSQQPLPSFARVSSICPSRLLIAYHTRTRHCC